MEVLRQVGPLEKLGQWYEDFSFDRRWGVNTKFVNRRIEPIPHGEGHRGMSPYFFREMMFRLSKDCRQFVFLDLGSGKGRALFLAAEYPFKKIIGVEYSNRLHSIAVENIRVYKERRRTPVDITSICDDAGVFPIPQDPLVVFLFNPFSGPVMDRVVKNLETSVRIVPREVYVLYFNPLCSAALDRSEHFMCFYRQDISAAPYRIYAAAGSLGERSSAVRVWLR